MLKLGRNRGDGGHGLPVFTLLFIIFAKEFRRGRKSPPEFFVEIKHLHYPKQLLTQKQMPKSKAIANSKANAKIKSKCQNQKQLLNQRQLPDNKVIRT